VEEGTHTQKTALATLFACVGVLFFAAATHCATIVVPNDLATAEGNGASTYPFGIRFTNTTMRLQQVFGASQFSGIPNGDVITTMRFRIDASAHSGFSWTLPRIQINLSTTTKSPDGLSTNFTENVGPDDNVVFGPGSLTILAGFASGTRPQPFEPEIELPTPFIYKPEAGNLLLDVRNFEGISTLDFPSAFDGPFSTNDSVSTVYSESVDADSANGVYTFGLVTQFDIFPFPRLTNALDTNSLLVTWPTQPSVFRLQSTLSLNPATWKPVTNGITGNSTQQTLTLPRDSLGSEQFFRLVWSSGPSGGN
jgi:hypothetical protein